MGKRNLCSSFCLLLLCVFLSLNAKCTSAQMDKTSGSPLGSLPNDLQDLDIKDRFIPSQEKRVGTIHALRGHVVVIHRKSNEAYFGKPGNFLYENDTVHTLSDSRCRLVFIDDDVVTMGEETQFTLDQFDEKRRKGQKGSYFSMMKGKAMFYAMRLFSYKETRFMLKTPTAIVGVRGTKFGVHVYYTNGDRKGEAGIRVAGTEKTSGLYLAQIESEDGKGSYTDAFCEDGYIDVAGKIAGPGEMYKGDIDSIISTPPKMIKAFERETSVKTMEGRQKAVEEIETDTMEESAQHLFAEIYDEVSESTQQETVIKVEGARTILDRPNAHWGYFTGMLDNMPVGPKFYGGTYRTTTITNLDGTFEASAFGSGLKMTVDGRDSWKDSGMWVPTNFKLPFPDDVTGGLITGARRNLVLSLEPNTGETITGGLPYPFALVELGYNQYMQWGRWSENAEESIHMQSLNYEYKFDTQGWYVEGDPTTDSQMSALSSRNALYMYSGKAYASYWHPDEGRNMLGSFSTEVDFNSKEISNFNVSVAGEGHSASIIDANGSFTGNSSQFAINATSGTWQVDGGLISTANREARGSIYGPNGEAVGGIFFMGQPGPGYVHGMFQGTR